MALGFRPITLRPIEAVATRPSASFWPTVLPDKPSEPRAIIAQILTQNGIHVRDIVLTVYNRDKTKVLILPSESTVFFELDLSTRKVILVGTSRNIDLKIREYLEIGEELQ